MRLFIILIFFYSSNIFSFEQNKIEKQINFFDKKPAEQREIFIEKLKNIISKKNPVIKESTSLAIDIV